MAACGRVPQAALPRTECARGRPIPGRRAAARPCCVPGRRMDRPVDSTSYEVEQVLPKMECGSMTDWPRFGMALLAFCLL